MSEIELNESDLTLSDLKAIYYDKAKLKLSEKAKANIEKSAATVHRLLSQGQKIYGINTGFGMLAQTLIDEASLGQLQHNLVLSHAVGVGEPLALGVTRLILAMKIKSFAKGFSGVSLNLVERMIELYNLDILPVIPEKGSVGASGDLAPLAHMTLPLIGDGEVFYQGKRIPSAEALKKAALAPLTLGPKEGLALLNGMQVTNAMCLEAYFNADILFKSAMVTGALSLDALCGSVAPFDARIQEVRGHRGQIKCAEQYRHLLNDSEINLSHADCDRVQDQYSVRCQPQVMGACLEQLDNVLQALLIEANAVSDNPVVFSEIDEIISGGNFHGEILAMNADNLALAISEIGALSERRIALIVDEKLSGLPAFLVKNSGLNSGFMIAQYTAAALASDNKALAHPHCVDSIPTSANQEDHVSMATNGARRLNAMVDNTLTIIAIELLSACQGLEFRKPLKTSPVLNKAYEVLREKVGAYDEDRFFAPDILSAKELVMDNALTQFVDFS